MTNDYEQEDQFLDRNLAEVGRRMQLPDEATAEQAARWRKAPVAAAPAAKPRLFTLVGAGSLLAACVTLALIALGPTQQSRVEASTIFESFHEAMSNGFSLRFDNLARDGFTANGRMLVAFAIAESDDDSISVDEGDAVFAEMRFQADDSNEELAGLDFEFAAAARPDNRWVFMKTHSAPTVATNPMLTLLGAFTSDGVVLDLDGLDEEHGFGSHLHTAFAQHVHGNPGDDASVQSNVHFEIGFGGGDAPPARPPAGVHHGWNFHFGSQPDSDESEQEEDESTSEAAELDPALQEAVEAFESMIQGNMTPEQVAALTNLIETAARDVEVIETPEGLHVLTARDFDLEQLPHPIENPEEMNAVLEIAYRQASGVEWARVSNIGSEGGVIHFELADTNPADPIFDRTRFTEQDGVNVIDVQGLVNLFHGDS